MNDVHAAILPSVKPGRPLTGRGVLVMLVGFFGVIFAVNIYFLVSALKTYTGVVSQEPYRKGLQYNQRIAADERQSQLGWTVGVDVGAEGRAKLTFMGADNKPVTALTVTATLGRPANDREDRTLTLTETQPGQYEGSGQALGAGGWVLNAVASAQISGSEPLYRLRKRLWLTP